MGTKLWAIGLMVLCTIFTSVAQVFYKLGAARLSFSVISLITNLPLLTGMALYVLGAFIMIIAFKGGDVSVLYPIIATDYIWVSLMAAYFFNEALNLFKWTGVFLIIAGIVFIGLGSKEKEAVGYTEVV
ncbi:hypothetical protein KY366_00820 [Candidatus Woesearchaeota archaeon]|nr:hypothetical protein [Candidatus Woesearchaeota archaeon]